MTGRKVEVAYECCKARRGMLRLVHALSVLACSSSAEGASTRQPTGSADLGKPHSVFMQHVVGIADLPFRDVDNPLAMAGNAVTDMVPPPPVVPHTCLPPHARARGPRAMHAPPYLFLVAQPETRSALARAGGGGGGAT
jgi:hypothetical protein